MLSLIHISALTEKDRRNIELAIELDIDFIAHSFVRNAADVKAVQDILDAVSYTHLKFEAAAGAEKAPDLDL